MKLENKVSENTLIPISLVLTIIGGVFWLTSMYSKVEAHEATLLHIHDAQQKFQEEVIDRLARIETKLVK